MFLIVEDSFSISKIHIYMDFEYTHTHTHTRIHIYQVMNAHESNWLIIFRRDLNEIRLNYIWDLSQVDIVINFFL